MLSECTFVAKPVQFMSNSSRISSGKSGIYISGSEYSVSAVGSELIADTDCKQVHGTAITAAVRADMNFFRFIKIPPFFDKFKILFKEHHVIMFF